MLSVNELEHRRGDPCITMTTKRGHHDMGYSPPRTHDKKSVKG